MVKKVRFPSPKTRVVSVDGYDLCAIVLTEGRGGKIICDAQYQPIVDETPQQSQSIEYDDVDDSLTIREMFDRVTQDIEESMPPEE